MGALTRSTRGELEDLHARDAGWWPDLLADVSDKGIAAIEQAKAERAWAWGAFKAWIRESPERLAQYEAALADYAEKCVLESIPIADAATPDDVQVAKLRGDRRIQVAGKLDRKWADKVDVNFAPITVEIVRFGSTVDGSAKQVEDASMVPT